MLRYKYKEQKDQHWLNSMSWAFPNGLNPSSEEELTRRKSRKGLSEELQKARRDHMIILHNNGASYALIGKLYKLDRSLVRKIIITN